MSSIDERVVEMKFKDSSFQAGVQRTLNSLKQLKEGLKLDGAADGLKKVGDEAGKIDLSGLTNDVGRINPLFAALATVGVTALSRLTNSVIDFGKNLVANVMEPLFGGGHTRALNLENARYSFKMLGIDATAAMEDANYAVEGTAYSLDVAAKAASQLSASQVALGDDMKAALRGISGVAALTNSSYEDISNIFTKVAGQGRLMGDDLNRLGSRGMNAAATLAAAFGTTEENIRSMVTKGEISFQDFANAMDNAYGEKAVSAAETYTGALGQMRTAIARIGADIQAPKLEALRREYNALAPAINSVKFAIQPLLDMFGELTLMRADGVVAMLEDIVNVGFGDKSDKNSPLVALQDGFRNIADSIMNVIKPIREAWAEVFPPQLGSMIAKFAFWFRDFTSAIKINGEAAKVIKDIFVGVFSALKTGLGFVGGAVGVIFNGLGLFFKLLGSIGSAIAPIISYVVNLVTGLELFGNKADSSASAMDKFFGVLKWAQGAILQPIIAVFEGLGKGIDNFLNKGQSAGKAFKGAFEPLINVAKNIGESFGVAGEIVEARFGVVGERIAKIWERVVANVKAVYGFLSPVISAIGKFFAGVRDGIAQMIQGADLNTVLATVNTGIFFVIGKALLDVIGSFKEITVTAGQIKQAFIDTLGGITGVLGDMQKSLRADAIMKIAIAIGILAASLALLATVEPDRMISAAVGLGTVAAALMIAVDKFSEILKSEGLIKMPLIAYSMILLGTAMMVMATAVKILSGLSWEELLTGLSGFAVILSGMLIAMDSMSKLEKPIAKTAASLMLLGVAMILMSGAVLMLAFLEWEQLAKGLGSVTLMLGLLVGSASILSKNAGGMTKAAGGILAFAFALGMLAGVIAIYGLIPWDVLNKGAGVMAILAVGIIAMAQVMSKNLGGITAAAGGILAMALAMGMLATAIIMLGLIPWPLLIQGLGGAAIAIAILVKAAQKMSGLQAGVAGMVGLAAALVVLSIALKIMSTIPIEILFLVILALGALVLVLDLAAELLSPVAAKLAIIAGVITLFALALLIVATAILVFTLAIAAMGPALISLVGGLLVFAEAADQIVAKVPAMLGIAGGLIAFGLGALVAGVGVAVLGVALIALGAGLALVSIFGLAGVTALSAVTLAIVNLVQYADSLIVMGAALAALGVGLILAGVGGILAGAALIVVAAGIMAVSVALTMLGPAMMVATMGMTMFLPAAEKFVSAVPALLALGAGLLAFGVGAFAAGAGIMVLGVALLSLGAGLKLVKSAGEGSAKVIKKVTETVAGLWGHAINIGIVAAALGGLGLSLMALGAGLILTGAGALLVVAAFLAFVAVSAGFVLAANAVVFAIQQLAGSAGDVQKAASSLTSLSSSINQLGLASMGAGLGIVGITMAFGMLIATSDQLTATITSTATATQAAMVSMTSSLSTVPPIFALVAAKGAESMKSLVTTIDTSVATIQMKLILLAAIIRTGVISALNAAKASASSGGYEVGSAITDGMARGIYNGQGRVASAAREVAAKALSAAKSELDSHSPSKKFIKLGEDSDEGFALGLEGHMGRVMKAAENVGGSAIYGLKKSISDISKTVAIDPDMRPVITPVLDLSAIRKDAPTIGRLLSDPRLNVSDSYREANAIAVDGNVSIDSARPGDINNVTFNQVNNSPKALSEAEIYRRTNNQIARLEKGVGVSNVN